MRKKKLIWIILLAVLAVALITLGLIRTVNAYNIYREDMLQYESQHLSSIIASSGRGIAWTLSDYVERTANVIQRGDIQHAEEQYLETGERSNLFNIPVYTDSRSFSMNVMLAVYDENGEYVNATNSGYPVDAGEDEALGENVSLRKDDGGIFWFIFSGTSENNIRYEIAVRAQNLVSMSLSVARVGESGYSFLIDRGEQMIVTAGNGRVSTSTVEQILQTNSYIDASILHSISAGETDADASYFVYDYQWPEQNKAGDTLVVLLPLSDEGDGLVVGAAVSFDEFSGFLSDTLGDVSLIILMELGGMLALFLVAAILIISNRRNAAELQVVRERADLMEEINREQQSLAHTERLQQLGVMTGGIIHEVNNMLTPIMSQSLLLLEELADDETAPAFDFALDIFEASEKARDVLKRMSGMHKKGMDESYKPLNLSALLERTMNLVSMAKDPHIVQVLELPDDPVYVRANDQLLTQAILNLGINACQAMGEAGTLTVRLSTEAGAGSKYARIEVMDTGPGIPKEIMDTIFDAFVTTKGENGTGIGLSICKKIVETHKGTVVQANRPEGGAMFTVRIPVCEAPSEEE